MKKLIYGLRYSIALKKANKIKRNTNQKCLILNVKGKPRVYTVQTLKKLLKVHFFGKGVTIRSLKKIALYTTN